MRGKGRLVLTRQGLMKIKSRAVRSGIWFKVLSRVERAIVDLTVKCVEQIRSRVLAQTISSIISKLLKTLEDEFLTKAERIGCKIVERLSTIAEEWGNKTCSVWKYDRNFIKFLGVNALNT